MIRPEDLVEALDRIHPRDRELLSLSLRRRVPDEALGRLYECTPSEVARRRARAIEQVADEMELQRGEDLGAVLQALLEPDTWTQTTVGEEFAASGGGPRVVPLPVPEPEPDEEQAPEPEPPVLAPVPAPAPARDEDEGEEEAEPPEVALAQDAAVEAPEEAPAAKPPVEPAPSPVEQMVAQREREAPDPPRRAVPLALLGLGIAALVGAAGVIGATQFGDKETMVPRGGDGGSGTQQFVPRQGGLAAPFPTEPNPSSCYTTATLSSPATIYRDPGGERRLRIGPKTEWGSERVMGVVSQRGDWLGVQASELKNGEIAWIQRDRVRLDCVQWSIHADLSKRSVTVQHDGKTVRSLHVAIGRSENPTPKGRFSVTDRLAVKGGDPTYGCCVLALTGHQTHLPAYWPGGDRLAIHATNDESSIGRPVSLGCMRAPADQARWLIDHIPLGTPVFIHS